MKKIMKTVVNQHGEEIAAEYVATTPEGLVYVELNCYSAAAVGMGACRCVNHPVYLVTPITEDEAEKLILRRENGVEEYSLDTYEMMGGEYSDAGNGGETVNKDDFAFAVRIAGDGDDVNILRKMYPQTRFWADSVTSMYLAYKPAGRWRVGDAPKASRYEALGSREAAKNKRRKST